MDDKSPDVSSNGQPAPEPGLPPVVPPSGRFIVQLFLVPGLIVVGAVIALLGFSWLSSGNRAPDAFLRDLESSNLDIRKRTASDLAQVLKRDDGLATDVDFGLKLTAQLRQAVTELDRGQPTANESASAGTEERNRRWYVQFLIASVGNLMTPVGGPEFADLARKAAVNDPKTNAMVRRQAVWALAALGESLPRSDKLPAERKEEVLAALDRAADRPPASRRLGPPGRGGLAKAGPAGRGGGAGRLCQRRRPVSAPAGGTRADLLGRHARRGQAGRRRRYSSWPTTTGTGRRSNWRRRNRFVVNRTHASPTLVPGPGSRLPTTGDSVVIHHHRPEEPGRREVRYNAALALARRGSPHVKDPEVWDMLLEMLDEEQQLRNLRTKTDDGREVTDETGARTTVIGALQAVQELHRKEPKMDLAGLKEPIEKLTTDSNPTVASRPGKRCWRYFRRHRPRTTES